MITELTLGILIATLAVLTLLIIMITVLTVLTVRFIQRFRVMHAERKQDNIELSGTFKNQ